MKKTKMSDWTFVIGDVNWVDYGATWCRVVDGVHWFLMFDNKAQWGDSGYYCQVSRVDVGEVDYDTVTEALRYVGLERGEADRDMVAYALHDYGVRAPMGEIEGNYPDRVRAQARRLADELMADDDKCAEALDRNVNAIGSTARDFGCGDSLAGLRRTAERVFEGHKPEPEAQIMLKMYAAAGGRTLGGRPETFLALAGEELKRRDDDGQAE